MTRVANILCAIAGAAIAGAASAQSASDTGVAPAASVPGAAADTFVIAAKTLVNIEIVEPLDSKTAKPGSRFAIRLAEPIMHDGRVVVPTGIIGEGEVVHAAKARMGGKAGELVLAARYLDCGATRIALGYFKFGQAGEDRAVTALAASMVIPVAGLFVTGGQMRVTPGTRANARVRSDIVFTAGAIPACAPPVVSQPQPEGGME